MLYSAWTKGKKHTKLHKPRQDRFITYQDGSCTILIIADGHGGESYVRSGFGARIACNVALDILKADLCTDQYPIAIKEKFDRLVKKHISLKPLFPFEKEKLGNLPEEYSYGTTLLSVKITQDGITALQIGDGKICLLNKDGMPFTELPEDTNCIGSNTSSLVQENAIHKFRYAYYSESATCALLYTDGYEPKANYPWTIFENIKPQYSNEELRQELTSRDKYGDDQTILLLVDDSNFDSELFHKGISAIKTIYSNQRKKTRLQNELVSLQSFLSSALVKYKSIYSRQVKDAEEFKRKSIEPRYQEYLDIKQQLDNLS